jgi:hypothetical protein
MADHDVGNVRFSVSDGGKFGWEQDHASGSGFVYPIDGEDSLFEGALVVGYDSLHVSHSTRNDPSGSELADWQVLPGGGITITTPGAVGDQDGFSRYSDSGAADPMSLEVTQGSFAWGGSGADEFVIVELTLKNSNLNPSGDIEGLYAGMFMDWDIRPWGGLPFNNAEVDTSSDTGFMWNAISGIHCGVHVLTEPGLTSFDIINNQDGTYGFTKPEYWGSLSGGISEFQAPDNEYSILTSTGPLDIPAGDSVLVTFAVLGGQSLEDLLSNVSASDGVYWGNISPRILSVPDTLAVAGFDYSYDVQAEDGDGDTLSFSLQVAPSWLSIDPGTGEVTGIPPMEAVGDTVVTVRVDDGHGGSDEQSYGLSVLPQVDLALTVTGTTVVPRGGILFFSTLIENNRPGDVEGDQWLSVLMPDSTESLIPEGLLNYTNPLHGQIFGNGLVDLSNQLFIPTQADTGSYQLIGRIGIFPDTIMDEESFGFRVVE